MTTPTAAPVPPATRRLVRPRHGRRIAGVCAGIADRFGWDRRTVRLLAVLSVLLPGPQVLGYLVLWVAMPEESV